MALTKVIGAGLGSVSSADLDGAVTINESSADKDFRVESNGNVNMLFVNGGTDRVGIGTNSPARTVQIVDSSATPYLSIVGPNGSGAGIMLGDTDDETVGRITYDNSVNNLQFWTNDAEQVRIHSNGVLSASDGIALGVGTANTASNVISDYEEGTWTPVVADASSGGNTGTYADNYSHKYIKIGNMVMITFSLFNINTSGMTGGNSFFVRGLPFNGVASGVYATNHVHFDSINTDATGATISGEVTSVGIFMDQNPHFRLFQYYDQSLASVKVQNLESGYSDILGNLTYYTA